MAERRMFAKSIIDTDIFLEMPLSAQALYFHLSMRADDDGFVSNPKKVKSMIGASDDDLKILIAKRYILTFESGVIVIKHWKIHNYIQTDRYKPTTYNEEKELLSLDNKKAYTEKCIQNGYNLYTQDRLGKDSIGKNKEESSINTTKEEVKAKRFVKPTFEQVLAYCQERNNNVDPQVFIDFYESKGWVVGKAPMKDWKAAVRTWERSRNNNTQTNKVENQPSFDNSDEDSPIY